MCNVMGVTLSLPTGLNYRDPGFSLQSPLSLLDSNLEQAYSHPFASIPPVAFLSRPFETQSNPTYGS